MGERRRRPQGLRLGRNNHPWADWQARSSLEPSAHQQSHPAHVVAGAGIVWRTSAHKGSPFLRRRAPAPNTADHKGSPGGSRSLASHRGTLRSGREKHRPAEHAGDGSRKSYLQVPQPGTAGRDAHTDKKVLRAGRPAGACGTRATPLKQGAAHGKWSRSGAFAAAATRARSATLGRTGFDR